MDRLTAGAGVADLVRHYWIPRWDLPDGQTKRQVVLGYPACNLVVEPGAITLSGPTSRVSHRDLAGSGWAVGALLLPAAGPAVLALIDDWDGASADRRVAALVDRECRIGGAAHPRWTGLRAAVTQAMAADDLPGATAALERFLLPLRAALAPDAVLANRMQQVVESSAARRVDELARALAVSSRSLQRLARTYVGLSPSAMIRRRRLQDAADEVRRDPNADLATVAVQHGYADHAHLTREFRDVLGFTPSQYRTHSRG